MGEEAPLDETPAERTLRIACEQACSGHLSFLIPGTCPETGEPAIAFGWWELTPQTVPLAHSADTTERTAFLIAHMGVVRDRAARIGDVVLDP